MPPEDTNQNPSTDPAQEPSTAPATGAPAEKDPKADPAKGASTADGGLPKTASGETDYKAYYDQHQKLLSEGNAQGMASGHTGEGDKAKQPDTELNVKWQDESSFSNGQKEQLKAHAKENGMDEKAAQGMADYGEKLLSLREQENDNTLKSTSAQWEKELKEHPTLGGQNYEKTIANVAGFLTAFTNDNGTAFKKILDLAFMGNNPDIFIPLALAGAKLADSPTLGAPSNNANIDPNKMTLKQRAHSLYKGMQ